MKGAAMFMFDMGMLAAVACYLRWLLWHQVDVAMNE